MDFVRDFRGFSGGFLGCYKIQNRRLKHAHYLSQVKEREEYYKNHVEEALKKDSGCFEKGGDKVDCSAAMRIAAGERNRRVLEIK
ncbi:hypothetical protein JP0044_12940 [Helicobacter pylori]|nr:hypothetical protein JP0044_12940 [Helicobacter pylori]